MFFERLTWFACSLFVGSIMCSYPQEMNLHIIIILILSNWNKNHKYLPIRVDDMIIVFKACNVNIDGSITNPEILFFGAVIAVIGASWLKYSPEWNDGLFVLCKQIKHNLQSRVTFLGHIKYGIWIKITSI